MDRAAGFRRMLFNKLPRTRLHNWVQCAFATQADIAQQADRAHAMAEAPGSMPGIRSRHLIAGVFRHNGRACVPRRAGTAGMCGAGTPALAQREHITAGHRARAGAQPQWDLTRSLRRAKALKAEIGRDDWAAPEPVTGWYFVFAPLTQRPECRPV